MERILGEIRTGGPMGFDRFMEIALYDPDAGYFAAGDLRSDRLGDFLTSPEVSSLFGETIARFVTAEHDRIGGPFSIVEVGAGSGSLLRPMLDALPFRVTHVQVVERSAAARASVSRTVPEAELLDEMPSSIRGVIVANELLDNLPAAIVEKTADGWSERVVEEDGDGLGWGTRKPSKEIVAWANAHAGPVPEGGFVEVQLEATGWVAGAMGRLAAGALLVFDYGDVAEQLEHRREEGTVRTYRDHHLGPEPLAHPGHTDITLDVNFSSLLAAADEAEVMRQDEFLERWGLVERLDELRASELEAARDGRIMEQLILKSRITEGETLLHPRGLGDFRVLVARA
jgi:SAM-dependent MidA family methyltransferase